MAHGIQRLDLSEALALLERILDPVAEQQTRSLAEARRSVSANNVLAPVSLPPFRSSAMDGYAARASDLKLGQELPVVGVSAAGHPFAGEIPPGSCIRILTGAVVPDSTDTVVIQEEVTSREVEGTDLPSAIQITQEQTPGANVRDIGHDVTLGSPLVIAGQQLNAFELAWLAACGVPEVRVVRPVRVGVLATGDELQPPGATLAPGQIFDSNRLLVTELLQQLPVEIVDLGLVQDDPDAIRQTLVDAAPGLDAIISTGGVSVGDADYITEIVASLGELNFWRLNLKPGKPMAVGRLNNHPGSSSTQPGPWFFGLPGNPVSCAVTCMLVAMPALKLLSGQPAQPPTTIAAQLTQPVQHRAGRQEYLRGMLAMEGLAAQQQAGNWVSPTGDQSSNRLASFQQANCLISVPKEEGDLEQGTWVEVLPLPAIL